MEPLGDGEHPIAGAFRIVAELARGGMGRVLLGVSPDGRLVAVKLVHAEFGDDHDFRSRFRREVAASRRVSGAYTAAVLDADPDAPLPWLASVFVPGPSLQQVVDRGGPLPTEALVRLAAGLAAALTEIHRVGLIHRDLKPSNVLLATDGPRVIDFGIARAPDDDGTRITHTGLTVGSPGFMSPEQAESSEITTASDMFSLGAVLVHAASGRSPFARSAPLQTLYSIVHEEADLTALPAELRGLVARCLSKDPAHRPTPAQFGEQLRQLPPTLQPWPAGVHDMIEAQHAEVARLLGLSETGTVTVESGTGRVVGTAAGGERTALVPGHPSSTPPLPSGPPGSPAADERAEPQEARPGSAFGPPVGPYADVTPPGAPNTGPPTGSADSNTWPGDTPRDRVPPGYLPIGAETDQVPGKPTERPRRLGRRAILFGAVGGIGALVGIPLAARLAGSSAAENAAPPPSDPPPSSSPDAPLPPGAPGVLERTSTYVLSTPIANGGPIVTAYSPDGELLALGDQRSGLILLDSSTLEVDTVLVKPGARVTWEGSGAVAFSPDGALLASADDTDVITLWDVAAREEVATFQSASEQEDFNTRQSLVFSGDGATLAFAMNGTVTLWDVTSHDEIATVHQPELAEEDSEPSTSIHGLAVTHDGGTVITCNSTGRLRFWDVQNQDLIGTATSHDTAMAALAISPDGRTVASGARGAVRLWQLDDRSEIEMLPCDSDRVGALAFSADGVLLAASHDSGVTRIWSTRTWEEVRKFSGDVEEATDALRSAVEPAFEPYSVSFSPDSKALAVPTNRHLVLWKLA